MKCKIKSNQFDITLKFINIHRCIYLAETSYGEIILPMAYNIFQ